MSPPVSPGWVLATRRTCPLANLWEEAREMYQTFELLRQAAEACRAPTRQPPEEIDPVSWEALLDRVEDQLEEEDRDDAGGVSADSLTLHTC